ncbi:acid protease [Xylariaceae sp. FL0804]|nr:acid protease [Xylariaceae sp. FL0804]
MRSVTAFLAVVFSGLLGCRAAGSGAAVFPRSNATAVEIAPSQYYDGNDGSWSTFFLRVGTPEQTVRVLVSTASPEALVVLSLGCTAAAFQAYNNASLPSDCATSRGTLFNTNQSTSWSVLGNYNINGDGVGLEANLDYSQTAQFAQESVGLGLIGPSLDGQIVGGIATTEPFYLGIFGLNNQPLNFSTLGNSSSSSYVTTLRDQGVIPSLSWSYTAGAIYRLKDVYGQLIFSGYDTSRFTENPVSFTLAQDYTRDIVVSLQSISYSGTTSSTLLSDSIEIFIDSTDPNLWLPDDVVDAFEDAFGLTLDDESGLYLINDTHHSELLSTDAQVTFRLSDVSTGGAAVEITLPYGAFDLQAQVPLVSTTSYYFPLKRAANATQYTLGRTFLQEAYLTVDYETGTFNVSACTWVEGAAENIVTIPSSTDDSSCYSSPGGCPSSSSGGDSGSSGSGSGSKSSSSSKLGGGAIAGIVIGSLAGVALLAGLVFLLVRRQRKKRSFVGSDPEPDMAVMTGPVHNAAPTTPGGGGAKYYSPETVGTSTNPSQHTDSQNGRSTHGGRASTNGGPSPGVSSTNGPSSTGPSPGLSTGVSAGPSQTTGSSSAGPRGSDIGIAVAADPNKPTTELDANAPQIYQLHGESRPSATTTEPGVVHELAGSEMTRTRSGRVSAVDSLRPVSEQPKPQGSPSSPFVSTLGSAGWQGERGDASSDLVSPSTPVQSSRPF